MVNKRMKAQAVLALARQEARKRNLRIEELPGRGKGSHRMYIVLDANGKEVGRFGLTFHAVDVSWTVLRGLEKALSHLFGGNWMERR